MFDYIRQQIEKHREKKQREQILENLHHTLNALRNLPCNDITREAIRNINQQIEDLQ